jgi:hypothetical protein
MQALAWIMRVPRGALTTWVHRIAMAALCCVLWLVRVGVAGAAPVDPQVTAPGVKAEGRP